PNYTEADSGKQTALDDALSAAENAKNSNDPSAVATATKHLQDAQSGLNGDSNLEKAKDQADQKIDDVAKAAKQAIDNTNGITDSEKQAAKGQADADANAAKEAIANADSTKAVTDAVNNGTVAIIKDDANAAIDGALAEKNNSIDAAPNLTDEEKKAVKGQAKTVADSAKTAISSASTVGDVASAKKTGVDNINNVNVPTTSATKSAAINTINTALSDKKKAINGTNLTNEEKSTLVSQAQKLADDAIANINKATTNDAVKTAKENGVEKINNINVPVASGTKTAAKNAIDQAAKAKNDAIDASNLTAEEKDTLKQTVAGEVNKAKAAIDAATKDADVTTAKNTGVGKINNITVPTTSATKDAAKDAIDQAAKTKDDAIDASNLTAEEKADLKKTVAGEVQTAKDNIDAATKDADVTTAKNTGVGKINNIKVPDTSATKDDANKAIDDALAKKIDEINKSNLTDEEKAKLTTDANADANNAKANIKAAKTNDAVNTAKETGVGKINNVNVPATSATKDDGIKAIDAALDNKKSEINNATNIDQATKDNLIQAATDAANKAKEAINQATTNNDVATEQTKGTNAIDAVKVPSLTDSQSAAKDVVDTAVAKQKELINNSNNLSDSEKQDLNQQVDAATKTAKDAIDAATTNDGATKAGQDGVAAIEAVTVPADSSVKKNAKDAIDKAAKTKDNAIDASNLTTEEKDALKKKVAGEVKIAKDNIDAATKDADVKTAQTSGEQAINAVEIPTSSNTKNDANSDLDTTAAAAKKAIDETSGLTEDQKQTAKDQIDQAVAGAKENIKNASDNTGVAGATDAGKLAIDKVSAKAAIDAAVAAKKSEIAQAPLTAEEAKPLNNLVDQDADAAKAAIDAATTSAAVETAKNNGVETINNIKVPTTSATKDDANKAIDAVLAKKIEEINNANLTDDQKPSLIDQAQNAATQAKENIRNASTDEDVQTARNNGIAAIEEITVKSNSVDDQDNSATNAGDSSQTGHIQKDKFPEGTTVTVGDDGTATVTYPDGSKDVIAGTDLVIAPKSEDVLGSKYHSHKNGSNSSQADRVKGASTANGSIANAGNNLGVKAETDNAIVGVKGESDNAIGNNKATSLKTLPQTGTKDTSILGVLGMLLASLGLFVFKKKRDKE
ncbi:DUF1542 domain-containing protein, partial [Lactobacillus crispatus]